MTIVYEDFASQLPFTALDGSIHATAEGAEAVNAFLGSDVDPSVDQLVAGSLQLLASCQESRFNAARSSLREALAEVRIETFTESKARHLAGLVAELGYASAHMGGIREVTRALPKKKS